MRITTIAALGAFALLAACQAEPEAPAGPVGGEELAGPPPMGDPANNPDMTALAAEVDADGNGELSRAEWQAKGLPDSSFNMFEQGRGFVTLADYQQNAAPAGIDLDGDGTLTVAEFVEFDRQMAAQMPPEGGAPAPAPE